MKIKKFSKITVEKTVEILNIEEITPSDRDAINSLQCSSCLEPLGDKRPVGLVWMKHIDGNAPHGGRFCHDCLQEAKAELSAEAGTPPAPSS